MLICALLATLLPLGVRPAAAQGVGEVSVQLTNITPETLGTSGDLTIRGTVTNSTDTDLRQVRVSLWRDATPLLTLADLARVSAGDHQSGAVMESPEASVLIKPDAALAPGETVEFSVHASLTPQAAEQLWLSEPGAAYQIGVEVYGLDGWGAYQRLGRATALAVYPGADRVPVATVVLLAARPSLLPVPTSSVSTDPVFADASLAAELAGRLDVLLAAAERPGTTTIIDPALYDEIVALAGPHQIRTRDGQLLAGSSSDQERATAWLARFDRLLTTGDVAVGLFGSPDVVAATAAGFEAVLPAAASYPAADHRLAKLPRAVVPAGLQVDTATLDALVALNPSLVLASNLAEGAAAQTYHELTALAVRQLPSDNTAATQQRAWLTAIELLTANQGGVAIWVVDDAADAAFPQIQTDWREPLTVREALARQGNSQALQLASVPEPAPAAELAAASEQAAHIFATFGELTDQPELARDELARTLATSWSSSFGADQQAQVDWLRQAGAPAAALLGPDAIQLRITDWVTTSAEDNLLPVTVNNNTDYPVHLRVHFESENPLRISVEDSELFVVEPGESATVRVSPRTGGNGSTAITAQLQTEAGRAVGAPVDFVITGTDAGRVAWLIILASGAVLLIATALRVRQVRREQR